MEPRSRREEEFLVIGSGPDGTGTANADFDDVVLAAGWISEATLSRYFRSLRQQVEKGPITASEEEEVLAKALTQTLLKASATGGGGTAMALTSCSTNGPVYLTNLVQTTGEEIIVSFDIAGGTNGILYDIFSTELLVGDNITNSTWTWLGQGETCNSYSFPLPAGGTLYYVLGNSSDDPDLDGLATAYETLVSKTDPGLLDTDGDLMPDGWEVLHGLDPLLNDAADDPDGDWLSNLEEYNAMSNPTETGVVAWGGNFYGQSNVPAQLRGVVSVAGGAGHSLALHQDGTVTAWGDNSHSQTNLPAGLTDVAAVAAGMYHSVALRADGSVVSWGSWFLGTSGFVPVFTPASLTNIVAIAAGREHDMALREDGTVEVWGYTNAENIAYTTVPGGLTGVVSIAAGLEHNVVRKDDGTVFVWGSNFGGLGWNLTTIPTGLGAVTAIAAGANHTLALRPDGTVAAWGAGNDPNGTYWADHGQSIVPVGLTSVIAISAGGYHSLALREDGIIETWGDLDPSVAGEPGFVAIGSGVEHALAIRGGRLTPLLLTPPADQAGPAGSPVTFSVEATGAVAGFHYQWQFGGVDIPGATNGTFTIGSAQLSDEGAYRVIVSTGAGAFTTAAATFTLVTVPEAVATPVSEQFLWVTNGHGQTSMSVLATAPATALFPISYQWVKDGDPVAANTPVYSGVTTTTSPDADYTVEVSNVAGSTNVGPWKVRGFRRGEIAAWGANDEGQVNRPADLTDTLSIAAGESHSVAARDDGTVVQWGHVWADLPAGLTNVMDVAAGYDHSLALRKDGTVVVWGDPESGGNVATNLTGVTAIDAGWNHNLALHGDGTVTAWGQNGAGVGWHLTEIPEAVTGVTAVAAGALHSLALRADGTVVAWGYSPNGQTNVPPNLANVVAIAAGGLHSLAVSADGSVTAWGYNGSGQCDVPADLTNALAVAAGWVHSVALLNDGTLRMWGDNSEGQLDVDTGIVEVKLLDAGGWHTLASRFSQEVLYPVDVSREMLLIYNGNSPDSSNLCFYYKEHRPMVSDANVLEIQCAVGEFFATTNDFETQLLAPLHAWLAANPTKHPAYIVTFLDVPSRFSDFPYSSVSLELHRQTPGINPFVTCINMNGTNDCIAYIDKVAALGTSFWPGQPYLSASRGGYGNTNYLVDGIRYGGYRPQGEDYTAHGATVQAAVTGLIESGVATNAIQVFDGLETITNGVLYNLVHPTGFSGMAGYISWGAHSSLAADYANDGKVEWTGNSGWWIIQTPESYNGQRVINQGNFIDWFSPGAFGGSAYENTPVGAITHVEEPGLAKVNSAQQYFGAWARGKTLSSAAWRSIQAQAGVFTPLQVVGDPLVIR